MLVKTTDDLKLDMIANILKIENAENDFEKSGLKKAKLKINKDKNKVSFQESEIKCTNIRQKIGSSTEKDTP